MTRVGDILAQFASAPFVELADITRHEPLLVLAPHPDDESLGCGGLIALATAAGDAVRIAVLTDGTGSHPGSPSYPPARLKALREDEARAAAAELGVPTNEVIFLGAPDAAAPTEGAAFDSLAGWVADIADQMDAGAILTTWDLDPHCDHQAAALIAARAARRIGARTLAMPIWGWTLDPASDVADAIERPRAMRLDITAALPAKRRAIAAHRSQMTDLIGDSPHGFRLDPAFLARFDEPWEVVIASDGAR